MEKGEGQVENHAKKYLISYKNQQICLYFRLFDNFILMFTNFSEKLFRIHKKLSKILIGHISESFHRISKIQNSVGRSGAWLSH